MFLFYNSINSSFSNVNSRKIVIFSDIKNAILHLRSCVKGKREIAARGVALKIQWVPSHIRLTGNDKPDDLAKRAISEGIEVEVNPSYYKVLGKYIQECWNTWKVYFD